MPLAGEKGEPVGKDARIPLSLQQLNSMYSTLGITAASIDALLARHSNLENGPECPAIYVNSSDPIAVIHRHVELADKKVVTVAGCGDLPLLLLGKSCGSMTIVDCSMFALFLTELKIRAVEQLAATDYLRLFRYPAISQNDYSGPFFDKSLYPAIRPQLSHPARAYFDGLLDASCHLLATVHPENRDNSALVRFRYCYPPSSRMRLPHIMIDGAYARLQERIRLTPIQLTLGDMRELTCGPSAFDYVYLSNIGYADGDQGSLAQRFLTFGSAVVGLTLRRRTSLAMVVDERGNTYPTMREAPTGAIAINVFANPVRSPESGRLAYMEPMLPGRPVTLGPIAPVIIGVSIGDDFPVYAEATAAIG
jgi:hypothetical protein